jgi:hypothetical protein
MATVLCQFICSKLSLLQGGSFHSDASSPMREISSTDSVLDDMQARIRKLERWNAINMVIFCNFSSSNNVLKFNDI